MSIEGERILSKMIPQLHVYFQSEGIAGMDQQPGAGWEEIVANQVYQWTSVLDLSGISAEHLTTFFTGLAVQEPAPHTGNKGVPPQTNSSWAWITDTISNEPFNANVIEVPADHQGQLPGFLASTTNWDDVIMASWRTFTVNQELSGQIGTLQLNQNGSFGSAEASASRKLYFSRILFLSPMTQVGDFYKVPPARFIAGTVIDEEKEHEYLMRLKRSSHNEQ
jgi:hypothetical protein